MSRAHGAALVLVLWLIALMTALVGAFALSARVEHLQQRVLDDDARGQERARAGLEYALTRLSADPQRAPWRADGRVYRWQFDDASIEIKVLDENGKINLNLADVALLSAFLKALGEERSAGPPAGRRDRRLARRRQPAAARRRCRSARLCRSRPALWPRNKRFETLGELQRVLGMRGPLYQAMLPHLTLYSRQARPDPQFASAPVLTALGLDADTVLAQRAQQERDADTAGGATTLASSSGTYSIESRATDGSGRRSVLQAVVRNGSGGVPGRSYTVLRWEQGMTAR